MERALWSGVSGMRAQQLSMDTIANNLANVSTQGFKASQIRFQDMLYTTLRGPGATSGQSEIPAGSQVGHGVKVVEISKSFRQGALKETGRPLDIGVEGDGFFEIILPDGTSAYTRDGSFRINSSGEVVTVDGYKVAGFDTIDQGTTEITIAPDGSFSTIVNGEFVPKTRLTLTTFINPEGLRSTGMNLYKDTEASGTPQSGQNPGESGVGTLAQRYLEWSNVNAAEEMVNLIVTQRAYEANSKAIKASDEMLDVANNLRR